jgi:hypothetical protein
MEIGTKPIPISVLTAVTNSALNAASVFPSRRIEISDSHSDLSRSADLQLASCATPRRCSAFNFLTSHCALHPRPHISRYGQAAACPRAAKNADVPKSPFPYSGSPGAVGRLDNTPNRVAFGCGCRKPPASGACPRAARLASHSSKAKTMEVPSILQGPWRLADWIDGIS